MRTGADVIGDLVGKFWEGLPPRTAQWVERDSEADARAVLPEMIAEVKADQKKEVVSSRVYRLWKGTQILPDPMRVNQSNAQNKHVWIAEVVWKFKS